MPTIAVLGSLNTDLVTVTPRIPDAGETLHALSFHSGPGGKGANQAVACARASRRRPAVTSPIISDNNITSASLSSQVPDSSRVLDSAAQKDVHVVMLGAVGKDVHGPQLISSLKSNGVDTTYIHEVKGKSTGTATILVEEASGENRILVVPGANGDVDEAFVDTEGGKWYKAVKEADLCIMQLEIPPPTVWSAVLFACSRNVLLNPAPCPSKANDLENLRAVLSGVRHLILNTTEAQMLVFGDHSGNPTFPISTLQNQALLTYPAIGTDDWLGVVFRALLETDVPYVVVTLGADGAAFASQKKGHYTWHKSSALKVESVVDTTGAGDTFVGAYAVEVVRASQGKDFDQDEAVRKACRAAAKSVQSHGAVDGMPWMGEF